MKGGEKQPSTTYVGKAFSSKRRDLKTGLTNSVTVHPEARDSGWNSPTIVTFILALVEVLIRPPPVPWSKSPHNSQCTC